MNLTEARAGRVRAARVARTAQAVRNPVWSVPVGLQLSLIYTLLLTVTLALLGWALYSHLEGFLVQNTADRLDRITRPILIRPFPPQGEHGPHPASGSSLDQAASYLVSTLSGPDIAVAVLDSQRVVIKSTQSAASGDAAQDFTLPAEWAEKVKSGSVTQAVQWLVSNPGSERQLVMLTPLTVRANDGSPDATLYLEQITSLGGADALLNEMRLYILLGILAGTVIGVIAGLALTRVILRPLDRMVRTAEAIAGGDLERRLRLPSGRNEVARLGGAFDHMVDRLGATLDAQRRFLADASHELRTPLTSLEGLSELLLIGADRGDAGVVQRTVRSMHKELERLGRLVADLLTLSRLDSAAPMKHVAVDVCRLLTEVSEQMGPLARSRGVRLEVETHGNTVETHGNATLQEEGPDACPAGRVMISGEPDRLKQVVLNLADNALRYTPEGGEVLLSALVGPGGQGSGAAGRPDPRPPTPDPRRGHVEIQVKDSGPGIAPADLPHIFDRFYRGDPSRARATGNTGLGLAIVSSIVQAHGGTITVKSEPGEGTCFTITLPALPGA